MCVEEYIRHVKKCFPYDILFFSCRFVILYDNKHDYVSKWLQWLFVCLSAYLLIFTWLFCCFSGLQFSSKLFSESDAWKRKRMAPSLRKVVAEALEKATSRSCSNQLRNMRKLSMEAWEFSNKIDMMCARVVYYFTYVDHAGDSFEGSRL